MIRNVLIIEEFNLIKSLNGIFFWLKKIPILGKLISANIYKHILKIVESVSWISLILPFITKIISKLIFYGIIVLIITNGNILNPDLQDLKIILNYISIITLLGFMKNAFDFYAADTHSYYFIRQFKMNPKQYFIGYFLFNLIVFAFTYAIAVNAIFSIIKIEISLINIVSFVIFSCSLRIFAALFALKLNLKGKKIVWSENAILSTYFILSGIMLVLNDVIFPFITMNFEILYNPIFLVVGIIIILLSFMYLLKQNNFNEVIYPRLTIDLLRAVNISGIEFAGVKTQDETMLLGEEDFSNYSGIKYINEIFFKRHERVYKKKTRIALLIKCLIYIAFSIGVFFMPELDNNDAVFFNRAYFVVLFASCYYMFSGNYFIKYCFYNMDYPLMKSNFYRKPEYIMEAMKIRFVKLSKNQIIPFFLMIIMIICINLRYQLGTQHLLISLASGMLGVLFFSLHYLFAYYIIQPFTKDLEIKNPLYNGLTYFIYMFAYFTITTSFIKYVFVVLVIFSIIYIILGFIGLKYLAPKRFKLH